MRSLVYLVSLFLIGINASAVPVWEGDGAPASPIIRLAESDDNQLVIEVEVPGIWITTGDSGTVMIAGESVVHPTHDSRSIPTVTALISVPKRGDITATLESVESRTIDIGANARILNGEDSNPMIQKGLPVVGERSHMRGMILVPVTIPLVRPVDNGYERVVRARIRVDMSGGGDIRIEPRYCTEAFYQFWNSTVLNSREILDPIIPIPGAYLFICPDNAIPTLEPLVEWKRRSGHPVQVAPLSVTGSIANEIQNYIANAYTIGDIPPEYVVLVGDVDGGYAVPTFFIESIMTDDCTDLPYTLIEGNDYFPEMLIGRLSISTLTELIVIVNKILSYERSPNVSGANWFERGLVVANADYNPLYQILSSPRHTKLWVREMMLESGFENVDTAFYPAQQSPMFISDPINQGVSFVNYRGYGHYIGWAGPYFSILEVYNTLSNINMLPVVTSIVCGGGNFAYENSPCFGEAWIRVGTPLSPHGAVAFVGPSELDTKTWFNNCIDAGIYWGIFHDELPTLGQALLRGKFEAYLQFPFYHAPGNNTNSVHFYYHVYGILGDPGLRLWTAEPTELTVDHPTEVPNGTNTVAITVTSQGIPVSDARVALATPDTMLAVGNTDANGVVSLVSNPLEGDSVWVTVTGRNRIPYLGTITVTQATRYISLDSYNIDDDTTPPSQGNNDGIPNPGELLEVTVTARNTGSLTCTDVTAVLRGSGVIDSTTNFGNITIGSSSQASSPFLIEIPLQADEEEVLGYSVVFRSTTYEWVSGLELIVHGSHPSFVSSRALDGGNGLLDPGEQAEVVMSFCNIGSAPTTGANISVTSHDLILELIDSVAVISALDPGDTLEISGNTFTMRAIDDILPAEPVTLMYWFEESTGRTDSGTVLMVLGEVGSGDPTAPDEYGYRAFDDGDSGYVDAPEYHWVEINPALGGLGENSGIQDSLEGFDDAVIMDLPFDFSFYGGSYQRITICSNGWVCLGETPMVNISNYGIPSAMSPPAMIAGFWDDLMMPEGAGVFTYHDSLGHRFIIEYYGMANVADESEETFQIILHDPDLYPSTSGDGPIIFQYQEVHDIDAGYNYATVGIQRPEPRMGVQYSYFHALAPGADSLVAGRAIQFITSGYIPGPYVRATGIQIDDDNTGGSSGNGNGVINNGETIELTVRLQNFGHQEASGVTTTLQSTDLFITILDSLCSFGTIQPQDTVWSSTPYRFLVDGNVPNNHRISLTLQIEDNLSNHWISSLGSYAASPSFTLSSVVFDDDAVGQSQGNDNGELNPGETIELSMTVANFGGNHARQVQAILRTHDQYITIVDSVDALGNIDIDDSVSTGFDFAVTLAATAWDSQLVSLELYLEDSTGSSGTLPFILLVKDFQVLYHHKVLTDPSPGNDNGYADPGETVDLSLVFHNPNMGTATGISAVVTTSDPNYTISGGTITFPDLPGYSQVTSDNTFSVTIDDSCRNPHRGVFLLGITADDGYAHTDSFHLTAGEFELFTDFDGDFAIWAHAGTEDYWDTTGIDFISFHKSMYCGNISSMQYPNSSVATLLSPLFHLDPEAALVFDHKYEFADTDYGRVMVQTNTGPVEMMRYTGSNGGWVREGIPLSELGTYDLSRVFFGISTNASGTAEGWWLDNVMIIYNYPLSGIPETTNPVPRIYYLGQAYPNPFNASTVIPFGVPQQSRVMMEVYNILGQRVQVLVDDNHTPGDHKVTWEAPTQGSGIYFIRMEAENFSRVRKIVLLK